MLHPWQGPFSSLDATLAPKSEVFFKVWRLYGLAIASTAGWTSEGQQNYWAWVIKLNVKIKLSLSETEHWKLVDTYSLNLCSSDLCLQKEAASLLSNFLI